MNQYKIEIVNINCYEKTNVEASIKFSDGKNEFIKNYTFIAPIEFYEDCQKLNNPEGKDEFI